MRTERKLTNYAWFDTAERSVNTQKTHSQKKESFVLLVIPFMPLFCLTLAPPAGFQLEPLWHVAAVPHARPGPALAVLAIDSLPETAYLSCVRARAIVCVVIVVLCSLLL